jgi:hypothetical protein
VCPILYVSPIFQSVGVFLEGVLQPIAKSDEELGQGSNIISTRPLSDHSIPYHKTVLLNHVKKLFIVHASSRTSAEGKDPTEKSDGDKLAEIDREGWDLAKAIIDSRNPWPRIDFAKLEYLLLNTWDDGRWDIYGCHGDEASNRVDYRGAAPIQYLEDIVIDLLRRVPSSKLVDICINAEAGVPSMRCLGESRGPTGTGLRIKHGMILGYDIYFQPYHVRRFMGAWPWEYFNTDSQIPYPCDLTSYYGHTIFGCDTPANRWKTYRNSSMAQALSPTI